MRMSVRAVVCRRSKKELDNHTFNTGVNEGPAADVESNVKLQSRRHTLFPRYYVKAAISQFVLTFWTKKVPLLGFAFVSSL